MSEYIIACDDETALWVGNDVESMKRIVCCRDCAYYNEKTYKWVNGWTRTSATCTVFDGCRVEPDGFCKWGERRA